MFKNKTKKTMTLAQVDEKLSQLRIPLSLVITPANLKEEKEKFFKFEEYSPKFTYKVVKNNNDNILNELLQIDQIEAVDPRISNFYIDLIADKKLAHDLMNSVGNNELFTDLSMQKFKMPTKILFRNACRIMRGNYNNYNVINTKLLKKSEYLNYDDVSKVFQQAFDEFGLNEWAVNRSKNIRKNGVKTGIKSKEIFIDSGFRKTSLEVKKTIVHELTHILRSHNGELSGIKPLSKPNLNSYLDVEEGLAMWNEENMGYLKDIDLKERASVVYAIYLGQNMSFRVLYNIMLGIYPKEKAFHITYLVKRGLGDTAFPGIFTKSASYLRGFRKVRKKLKADASLFNKLYVGKIGFKQVKWVNDGLIASSSIVPSKKVFEKVFKNFQ